MQLKDYILSSLFSILVLSTCTKNEPTAAKESSNTPPEIIAVSANPPQIGKGQTSMLSVLATDNGKEEIQYDWSAQAGVFLQGTDRKFALWKAPDILGRYECKVIVSDGKETAFASVLIDVIDVAILRISADALDFSYNEPSLIFTIENSGEADMTWQIVTGKNWIRVNPATGNLSSHATSEVTVTVDRENLSPGEYVGLIGIRSNGGARDISAYLDVPMVPKMIRIPAGEFTMGSENGNEDEWPVQAIYLNEFWIDKYEVTNAQYADFLNAAKAKGEIQSGISDVRKNGNSLIYLLPIYREGYNVGCPIMYANGRYTVERNETNTPVRFVTWYGASAYAEFYGYRLPTEAEWERAAKGLTINSYPWGNSEPTKWDCNYNDELGHTKKVGFYSPLGDSPYGCADMAGNVWEWCSSLYNEYPYAADDGREDLAKDGYRVLRGGAWDSPVMTLRCALRSFNKPSYKHPAFGFRCAK